MINTYTGEISGWEASLEAAEAALGERLPQGLRIRVQRAGDRALHIRGHGGEYTLSYGEPVQIFRGLGLIAQAAGGEIDLLQTPRFDTNGFMVDVSQSNAVLRTEQIKDLLTRMALMGLNTLYLYMEDSFDVEGEPYFGHMRSRYTQAELREIDDWAFAFGITVIPCVQTLAHLKDVLKWPVYRGVQENPDTLLVGDERAYEIIERILRAAAAPFRSRRVHIGMDEAWGLGRGASLDIHGYRPLHALMLEHMQRVDAICRKLDIEPMMWSDMLINAAQGCGTGMANYYNTERELMPEIRDYFPRDMIQVYWDYNHHDPEKYIRMVERHRLLADHVVFAGGIWNWNGYTVDYDKTFAASNAALIGCKAAGVREVFATTWGDGGCECDIFAALLGMQLFAEHGYADDVEEEALAQRFAICTGCHYEDFRRMTYLDNLEGSEPREGYCYTNASRLLMWQDILSGVFDAHVEGKAYREQYERVYREMRKAAERNGEYGHVFELLSRAADVLRIKADVGVRIKRAYDQGNREALSELEQELGELTLRIRALRCYHRSLWYKLNKPVGWEILDARYGTMMMRADTARMRLEEYLTGEIGCIEELEEPRLPYDAQADALPMVNSYQLIASACRN